MNKSSFPEDGAAVMDCQPGSFSSVSILGKLVMKNMMMSKVNCEIKHHFSNLQMSQLRIPLKLGYSVQYKGLKRNFV